MPDLRPTCPIGDRHVPLETDMLAKSNWNFNTFKYPSFYILLSYLYIFIYVGHVGFRWVSDEACRGLRWDL